MYWFINCDIKHGQSVTSRDALWGQALALFHVRQIKCTIVAGRVASS